jgi:lipopolysaccharide transport system ATP-binding protein
MTEMNETAIRVEGLGKRFRIGAPLSRRSPRRGLRRRAAWPLRVVRDLVAATSDPSDRAFWALRDLSFEVAPGEALGIIGRNGAGKSTLLKILSRITEPTEGRAEIRGRVSSLLEVGTGFHPELTGRENVFLNGAILGMRRSEIRARFDEIVEFSGVERFIDTPVKRFSSGMRVRLAFAVAAHLEPEILIVDEVLAVGDTQFQQRCLGRMKTVTGDGRTVLFVSHNLAAVEGLCSRALLLRDGRIAAKGEPTDVVGAYLSDIEESAGSSYACDEAIDARAWIQEASLCDERGLESGRFSMSEPIGIRMLLRIAEASHYTMSIQLKEFDGNPVAHFPSEDAAFEVPGKTGEHAIQVTLPPLRLYPGRYLIRLALTDVALHTQRELQKLSFTIVQDGKLCQRSLLRRAGLVFADADWRVRAHGADS